MKEFNKRMIRGLTWKAKKKAVWKLLALRCRRDGLPEYGRFNSRDIARIILRTHSNIEELAPLFKDFGNIGNNVLEYAGLIDLAVYRALRSEGVESGYAANLIGDLLWQFRVDHRGSIPIFDALRLKLARMTTKSATAFLGKRIRHGMRFPYGEPGYKVRLHREGDVFCTDFYSCAVWDFFKQFGQEEKSLFRKTWCNFDYAVAELIVEGGRYKRDHTLSDGDEVCDMRWWVGAE